MLLVPNVVFTRYVAHLNTRGIAADRHGDYKKWLRYYLDFCDKYPVPESKPERVRLFCEKMHEKKQSEKQRQQAAHAVSLYFERCGSSWRHKLKIICHVQRRNRRR